MTGHPPPNLEGSTREQLSALLSLAATPEAATAPPPLVSDERTVRRRLAALELEAGHSADALLDELAQPGTPIERLHAIKQVAKRALHQAPDEDARHAARFIYHLAIAAAWGNHGATIT